MQPFLVLLLLLPFASSGRILAYYGLGSISHKNFAMPLFKELAKRGHELTVVTPWPTKIENVNDIIVDTDFNTLVPGASGNWFESRKNGSNSFNLFKSIFIAAEKSAEIILTDPRISNFTKGDFDLVLHDGIMNEYAFGLHHKLGAPVIQLLPSNLAASHVTLMGGPLSPVYFRSDIFAEFDDVMTFFQRILNTLLGRFIILMEKFVIAPLNNPLIEKYFPGSPSSNDVQKELTVLIFVNSHFSINGPKPYLPSVVELAGMHCREAEKLPKDLSDFVEGSGEDGFILFSFGSVVRPADMPEKYRKSFVEAFRSLKQRVIWKWDSESMEDQPSNVKLVKWLPQQDLLGHPKARLFITHGGYASILETMYHGVPTVGVPFMADQDVNIRNSVKAGIAEMLELTTITTDTVLETIQKILNNKSYYDNGQRLSSTFRDRFPHPLETAVYWVEHVLKHKGTPYLKAVTADMSTIQFYELDIYCAIGLIFLTLLFALFLTIKVIKKVIFKK